MICNQHYEKNIGICLNCSMFFCEQCFKMNHFKHYRNVELIDNIYYSCHLAKVFCSEIQEIILKGFEYESEINENLNQTFALREDLINKLLQEQAFPQSIEFYLFHQQLYQREQISYFLKEIKKGHKNKNQILSFMQKQIMKYDQKYLMIKNTDIYYLLIKQKDYEEALWLYNYQLSKLLKKSIFFNQHLQELIENSIKNNFNYIQANQQIQAGRNLYILEKYQDCINFMEQLLQNNPQQLIHDQAQIYLGLSLFEQKHIGDSLKHFEKIKNQELVIGRLFKCFILARQQNYQQAINICERLHFETKQNFYIKLMCKTIGIFLGQFVQQSFVLDKAKLMYTCYLLKTTNHYTLQLYLGFLEILLNKAGSESIKIAEKLIKLKPNKPEGYFLKCVGILLDNQIEKADAYCQELQKKFPNQSILQLFLSNTLFLQGEIELSYEVLVQIPNNFFANKFHRVIQEIVILMDIPDFRMAFQILIDNYENVSIFYTALNSFCVGLSQFDLNNQAYEYIQNLNINQEEKRFIPVLLGKILHQQGKLEEALMQFIQYPHDCFAEPYVQYYKGQVLLQLRKFEDAADCFEATMKQYLNLIDHYPFQFLFYKAVLNILQGNFQEASETFKYEKNGQISFKFLRGYLQWIQGALDQALLILQDDDIIKTYPIVKLVLCWIYKQQKIDVSYKILLDQVQREIPKFLLQFNHRYLFNTEGLFSEYIMENQDKFNQFDDKKFQDIKFLALFLDTYGFERFNRDYNLFFSYLFQQQLQFQMEQKINHKLNQLIKNFPFV